MAKSHARRVYAQKKQDNTKWIVGGLIAAVALVLGLVVVNQLAVAQPPPSPTISAGKIWGSPNAPVKVELFGDFQCPNCARADAMLRQLAARYIDSGKVQIIYRHFAFIGPESVAAAQAAECANDQKKFWEYANYVYAHQAGENVGAFSNNNLKSFAVQLGLDTNAFNACFDSGKYASVVQKDLDEGRFRGIRATPSFFVNGQMLEGALPADQFGQLLDQALARQ